MKTYKSIQIECEWKYFRRNINKMTGTDRNKTPLLKIDINFSKKSELVIYSE